jgi:putative endonuclease
VYYVYVLKSLVTGRYYTGSTADVADRLRHHNSGATKSTRHGIPWVIVYTEAFATKQEALRRERYLKTGHGRAEIADRILPTASEVACPRGRTTGSETGGRLLCHRRS